MRISGFGAFFIFSSRNTLFYYLYFFFGQSIQLINYLIYEPIRSLDPVYERLQLILRNIIPSKAMLIIGGALGVISCLQLLLILEKHIYEILELMHVLFLNCCLIGKVIYRSAYLSFQKVQKAFYLKIGRAS